jgi:adenylate cyclase
MKPHQKRDGSKIIQFGILWVIGGILYSLLEYGILGDANSYPSTNNPYQFKTSIISSIISTLIIGLLIGTIETKILKTYFDTRNFWQKITFKTTLYVSLIILLLLTSYAFVSSSGLNVSIYHEDTLQAISQFVCNFSFWSIMVYAGAITVLTLFIAEVSYYLGGGVCTICRASNHYFRDSTSFQEPFPHFWCVSFASLV